MLKHHVVHVAVDGTNQNHIAKFQALVDQSRNDPTKDVRKVEFFVTSTAQRAAVTMTAIFTYTDRNNEPF